MSRVFLLGDDVDTDSIAPGGYLHLNLLAQKKHCLESIYKNFSEKVREGDIIIAGENFGCGSSREQAPLLIKSFGISLVLARSFSRLFFRNAVNIGLYPGIITAEVPFTDGDDVVVNEDERMITSGKYNLYYVPPTGIALEILDAGGMINYARKVIGKG